MARDAGERRSKMGAVRNWRKELLAMGGIKGPEVRTANILPAAGVGAT